MNRSSLRHTTPLTLAIVLILIVMVAACGATPTLTPVPATAVPATATKAATAAPVATTLPTATTAAAATTAPAPVATTAAAPTATKAATVPVASTVSFSKDVLPIFQKNCTRCHGGNNPRAGLSLESYATAMKGSSNGAVITAGNPDSSPVYTLVKSGVMPFGGTKLADADAQKIFDWIKAGALNN
jgi:hypothetical protein